MMEITPPSIREQQFKTRFRGFDVNQVDEYLDQLAEAFAEQRTQNERLSEQMIKLEQENREFREREETFKRALISSQKIMEQMKDNARKSAELIISTAEVKAEKTLNRAHVRLAQLHEDIAELKRQRIQLETQIRSILEAHSKLLDMEKKDMEALDEQESKLAYLKKT